MSAISGAVTALPSNSAAAGAAPKTAAKDHHGFDFGDLLDIVNPLQHIPIVNTLYRKLTGDEMSPTAEIAGGALFGGLIGAVSSVADVLFTQATGKNFGDTVYAWLGFDGKDSGTQLAKAQTPAASQAHPVQTGFPASGRAPVQTLRPAAFVAPAAPPAEIPGANNLLDALNKQHIDPEMAARAAFAYRSAIGLPFASAAPKAPSF